MEENTTKNNDVECGNECINKGRPVYFSYARNSSRKPEWETISDCVDKLLDQFDAENIEYRLDKTNIIHCPIGKASFGAEKLDANFTTLIEAIVKAKPAAAKGTYLKSCVVTSTMGVGVPVSTAKYGA